MNCHVYFAAVEAVGLDKANVLCVLSTIALCYSIRMRTGLVRGVS